MVYREKTRKSRMIRESQYGPTLCHFNPYHDPKNGQFTEPGGSGAKGRVIVSQNRSSISAPVKNNTSSSAQNNANANVNDNDNKNREKLKKALKIGGIALGSALVILGARYLIDDAVQTYAKKYKDSEIGVKTVLSTLSFDPERTLNTDMFYATYHKKDKSLYGTLFNTPIRELKDKNGAIIGHGVFLKKRIDNIATNPIRVASESSGAKIFEQLCRSDSDFADFVFNKSGMQSLFVEDKYKFKGYRKARETLEKARISGDRIKADYQTIYRMFNYVIPNTDQVTIAQRAKFFSELSKAGYGAVLDTNDALYGGFKAKAPVIVFDMTKIAPSQIYQTTLRDKKINKWRLLANKTLGLNL